MYIVLGDFGHGACAVILYDCVRSLLSGLMWFVYDGQFNIRHTCEHGDHLQRYGWIRHDGTSFGQQEIIDNGEQIYNRYPFQSLKIEACLSQTSSLSEDFSQVMLFF